MDRQLDSLGSKYSATRETMIGRRLGETIDGRARRLLARNVVSHTFSLLYGREFDIPRS